jgi:hypothetical protein
MAQYFRTGTLAPFFMGAVCFTIVRNYKISLSSSRLVIRVVLITLLLISIHYEISGLFVPADGHDFTRFVGHLVCLSGMVACSLLISKRLALVNQEYFSGQLNIIAIVFMFCLSFGFFELNIFNGATEKPVGAFHEPSHFALAFAPFYLYWMLNTKTHIKILISCVMLIYGLFYGSLITILLPLLLLTIRPLIFVGSSMTATALLIITNSEYFINRLFLFREPTNENIYFLQSIDEMINTLSLTYAQGLGFGQMGVLEPTSELAKQAFILTGDYVVRYEGANDFIKLSSEFGVLGIAIALLLVFYALKSYFQIYAYSKRRLSLKATELFSHCVIFTSILLLLVRGGGYFNFSILILISAYLFIYFPKLTKYA